MVILVRSLIPLSTPNSRLRKATAKALFSKNREISATIGARASNNQQHKTKLCALASLRETIQTQIRYEY